MAVDDAAQIVHTIEGWRKGWLGDVFKIEGNEVRMSVKTGVAIYPTDGTDPVMLIRNAEAALKNAKSTGDRLLFYAPHLSDSAAEALALENHLRRAIELEQFVLYYQPKVDVETRRVVGVEALIRWRMLAAEEKEHVVLACEAGDVYQPPEIALLRTRAV